MPVCLRVAPTADSGVGRYGLRGFTLIEVLVVIVVIGLLIAAIGLVAVKVIHHQKVSFTQTIMRNTRLAIDQFANDNPLGSIYDQKANVALGVRPTFGKYPPYQLANRGAGVAAVLEPFHPCTAPNSPANLAVRLACDLSGSGAGPAGWVNLQGPDANDDIRALYTYLRVYANSVLTQVPPAALKPLDAANAEYVNPTGAGTTPGNNGLLDVLGIHDAWGVPMDYFLYVKLEWSPTGWTITQRVPALRSLGIDKDTYAAARSAGTLVDFKDSWIFSEPFPSPPANQANATFWQSGVFSIGGGAENGWARAIGAGDLVVDDVERESAYGFVP